MFSIEGATNFGSLSGIIFSGILKQTLLVVSSLLNSISVTLVKKTHFSSIFPTTFMLGYAGSIAGERKIVQTEVD